MATGVNGEGEERREDWTEFCEKQALVATAEFAKSWKAFRVRNIQYIDIESSELSKKFTEYFNKYFNNALGSPHNGTKMRNGSVAPRSVSADDILEAASDTEGGEVASPKITHKPFFRRLSFKGLKKGKSLFLKQHSDEVELSPHHDKPLRNERHKMRQVKLSVECMREGVVNLLAGDTIEGRPQWVKCRLVLVRVAAGPMLEFYAPPKSMKPRTGVFCISICEARETTDLEMPDLRNTFVIKADSGAEWVVEGQDQEDMRGWLATITTHCTATEKEQARNEMRPPMYSIKTESSLNLVGAVGGAPAAGGGETPVGSAPGGVVGTAGGSRVIASNTVGGGGGGAGVGGGGGGGGGSGSGSSSAGGVGEHADLPPDLPPRVPGTSSPGTLQTSVSTPRQNNLSRVVHSHTILGDSSAEDIVLEGDIYARMREYPWFHGTLSRSDAAAAVLQEAMAGHGIFLVRQSETRKGEYVLTFNYQGRAKHLRMTINPDGACRVQHLSFPSIFDLLEYFRDNHIPLESGGTSDVTLTEFVIAMDYSTRHHSLTNPVGPDRRAPNPPDTRELATHGGSVRMTSSALERLQYEQSNSGGSTGRAVENTYTYT